MSQETINLLIGGLIGILGSLGATWLNFHYIELQENKKRNWELIDRKHIEKREIIKQRVEQTENYFTKYLQFAKDMINYENEFLDSDNKPATTEKFNQTISTRMKDIEGMAAKPLTLKNQELNDEIGKFRQLISDEAVHVSNMSSLVNSKEYSHDVEFIRRIHVTTELEETYKDILSKLDEILISQD